MSNHSGGLPQVQAVYPWFPFVVVPAWTEDSRPAVFEFEIPADVVPVSALMDQPMREWAIDDVFTRFAKHALYWHGQITQTARRATGRRMHASDERTATIGELREWIEHTRGLVDRLPFSGSVADLMREACERISRTIDSPERFFVRWPATFGTKANYEWRTSLNLWAMDRLARAVNAVELQTGPAKGRILSIPLDRFWTAMFPDDDAPVFGTYKEAQKRVARLTNTIKPGVSDALMVHLLAVVLHDVHPATPAK